MVTGEGRGVAGKWMEFGKYRCTVVHPVFVKDVEGLLVLSQGHATIGAFPNPRSEKSDTQFLPLPLYTTSPANLPVLLSIRYPRRQQLSPMPKRSEDALREYEESNDDFEKFVLNSCVMGDDLFISTKEALDVYIIRSGRWTVGTWAILLGSTIRA